MLSKSINCLFNNHSQNNLYKLLDLIVEFTPDHVDHIPDHIDHIPDHIDHIPDHIDHIPEFG